MIHQRSVVLSVIMLRGALWFSICGFYPKLSSQLNFPVECHYNRLCNFLFNTEQEILLTLCIKTYLGLKFISFDLNPIPQQGIFQTKGNILTPDRRQSKTLLAIEECGSKMARKQYFRLPFVASQDWRQMAIENSVSNNF